MSGTAGAERLGIGLLGAGRIGSVHAATVAGLPGARLLAVHDPQTAAAEALIARHGGVRATADAIFADPAIDAVLICTPTDCHAEQVEQAARSGKAILCEKPIDLDAGRVAACLAVVADCGVPLMVGFNRRFDAHFANLKARIDADEAGEIELVQIVSRDPAPPPVDYVRRSGGLFRDMMIHDLDMARFLIGEEFTAVAALASVLVDPAIGAAGDVDTACVTLRTASGKLCIISNSRRATYGYDQRIEVHGSRGLLSVSNPIASSVSFSDASGHHTGPLSDFFMDRYAAAYRAEVAAFCSAVSAGAAPAPNGTDGLAALRLADAALLSLKEARTVSLGTAEVADASGHAESIRR